MFRSSPFDLANLLLTSIHSHQPGIAGKNPELVARRSDQAETINYRTFKPERDGLFCARILARSPIGMFAASTSG